MLHLTMLGNTYAGIGGECRGLPLSVVNFSISHFFLIHTFSLPLSLAVRIHFPRTPVVLRFGFVICYKGGTPLGDSTRYEFKF